MSTPLYTLPRVRPSAYGLRTAFLSLATVAALTGIAAQPAYAEKPAQTVAASMTESAPAPFQRRNKTLKGAVQVIEQDGRTVLRLSDDFRASNGPDLKIFLHPERVETITGKTATDGAVLVSLLENTRGSRDYVLPEGVNAANFGSVLIHCEQFSVLWGGANI